MSNFLNRFWKRLAENDISENDNLNLEEVIRQANMKPEAKNELCKALMAVTEIINHLFNFGKDIGSQRIRNNRPKQTYNKSDVAKERIDELNVHTEGGKKDRNIYNTPTQEHTR